MYQPKTGLHPAFYHTNYLLRKKFFKLFGAAFHIYDLNGNVLFYSKQKAFKLKEDIRVFTSEDMTQELLVIQARKIIDISSAYDVFDSITKEHVGVLKRKGLKSMLRDEWIIMDQQEREIGLIQEDSTLLAVIRRFLTNLVPQTFNGTVNGQMVFSFSQYFNPFIQKIDLDFSMDRSGVLDRRLGIAAAVLLCAIEGRQG